MIGMMNAPGARGRRDRMRRTGREMNAFEAFSRRHAPRVDAAMKRFFDRKIARATIPGTGEWLAMLREYCARGGKRVRPLVLMAAHRGYCRGRAGDIAPFAAALELMHSMLLVQDDIIDRATVRRGGAALHVACAERFGMRSRNRNVGADVALVMADALMAGVMEIVAGSPLPPAARDRFQGLLAETLEVTAWGQVMDIIHSRADAIDDPGAAALRIATMKTAYYTICNPMLMGRALAGGRPGPEEERIRAFALPLGIAFQIRDDILGVFGSEDSTGKPSDSDIAEGKITFLVSGALERLGKAERRKFQAIITRERKSSREIREARRMIVESGSLAAAREHHRGLVEEARRLLPSLGISDSSRAVLAGLADGIEAIPIST